MSFLLVLDHVYILDCFMLVYRDIFLIKFVKLYLNYKPWYKIGVKSPIVSFGHLYLILISPSYWDSPTGITVWQGRRFNQWEKIKSSISTYLFIYFIKMVHIFPKSRFCSERGKLFESDEGHKLHLNLVTCNWITDGIWKCIKREQILLPV